MMHLEAIQERNRHACQNAEKHRERHKANAREWLRRAHAAPLEQSVGGMFDAALDENLMAGNIPRGWALES